jgi:hypothetical protein
MPLRRLGQPSAQVPVQSNQNVSQTLSRSKRQPELSAQNISFAPRFQEYVPRFQNFPIPTASAAAQSNNQTLARRAAQSNNQTLARRAAPLPSAQVSNDILNQNFNQLVRRA